MTEIIDPDREIIDTHHHLWTNQDMGGMAGEYVLGDLRGDTGSGHRVIQTVFMECSAQYRNTGEPHLLPVGETEFVARLAEESERTDGATIAGIVAHADLSLPLDLLDEVLDAHLHASGGRFRGIRDALSSAPPDVPLMIPGGASPEKSTNPDFRRGVAHLGERGFTYDTWHYHLQNRDFLDLARSAPGTTMVLDHFGTPLGVGRFAGAHDEIFATWTDDIAALAECPNVVAKLGGLAMPDNGFGWHLDPSLRPDVATFVAAQHRWYDHALQCFGPERCLFESNFPVDKFSVDYDVMLNGVKTMVAGYSVADQDQIFSGTARRVYRL